jgi:hypothetical protein
MWIFRYLLCLIKDHIWVGSSYRYCLRCSKLELATVNDHTTDVNEPMSVKTQTSE